MVQVSSRARKPFLDTIIREKLCDKNLQLKLTQIIKNRDPVKVLKRSKFSNFIYFINTVIYLQEHQQHCSILFQIFRTFAPSTFCFGLKITFSLQPLCSYRLIVAREKEEFLHIFGGRNSTMFWLFHGLRGCSLDNAYRFNTASGPY